MPNIKMEQLTLINSSKGEKVRGSSKGEPTSPAIRASVPIAGRSLFIATEKRAKHIRQAADILSKAAKSEEKVATALQAFSLDGGSFRSPGREYNIISRAAWILIATYITARLHDKKIGSCSFKGAERWFKGSEQGPFLCDAFETQCSRKAAMLLEEIDYNRELYELLPYVLDPIGPSTRLTVMKDPSTKIHRTTRKSAGVFYTPSDVADYIVQQTLNRVDRIDSARVLDPACGTGVFLKAVLHRLAMSRNSPASKFEIVRKQIYGMDRSTIAIDMCAFILLNELLPTDDPPITTLKGIQKNLAVVDSLRIENDTNIGQKKEQKRLNKWDIEKTPLTEQTNYFPIGLTTLYPEINEGFDAIVGNPPYTHMSKEETKIVGIKDRYQCLHRRASLEGAEVYPMFMEMMPKLGGKQWQGGMVVPLSFAFSLSPQFVDLRNLIADEVERLQIAFFDRQPHGLFGEEVKTRNAIVIAESQKAGGKRAPNILVSPMMKWTSRTRKDLFSSLRYTTLPEYPIEKGIPRPFNKKQAIAISVMEEKKHSLGCDWESAKGVPFNEAILDKTDADLFVASTGYNFINVFIGGMRYGVASKDLSTNKVWAIKLKDARLKSATFSVLASRLVHWHWYCTSDGFHVSKGFLSNLPMKPGSLSNHQLAELTEIGDFLWSKACSNRIESLNKGRRTIAFDPIPFNQTRREIDKILISVLGLNEELIDELDEFTKKNILVDESDPSRERFGRKLARCTQ